MLTEIITFAEIKQGLKGISRPFFANWIWYAKNKGYLDPIADGLLQSNAIKKPIEAINYLAKAISDDLLRNTKKVNYTDFQESSTSKSIAKKLIEKVTGESLRSEIKDKTTRYGSYGHSMAATLFSGELIPSGVFINGTVKTKQFDLFSNEYAYTLLKQHYGVKEKKIRKKLFVKLVEKIERTQQELLNIWKKNGHLPNQSTKYAELLTDLHLIYGEHLMKVRGEGLYDPEDQYLSFLTVMTWVQVLLYYKKTGGYPLFSEVAVLKNSENVGVGRLDILTVLSINGIRPSLVEQKKIKRLSSRAIPFDSVGHIIRALIANLGENIELEITDWKFAVGDGVNGMKKQVNIIYTDDVLQKPLKKHEDQVKRYLSMSVLSHALASGFSKLNETERLWETGSFKLVGRLVYFLPDRAPIVHKVVLTTEELKSVFTDQIVSNFGSATRRAILRVASNIAMTHVYHRLLQNKSQPISDSSNVNQLDFSSEIPLLQNVAPTVSEIILEHHVPIFKDPPTNFIELVGYRTRSGKKEELLEMHINRLFKAIAEGAVITEPGFNMHTGGKICCPVHGEKSASLSIEFDIGRFTCFGCEVRGNFNLASVPDGIDIGSGKYVRWELDSLIIPPRHREVMTIAQQILHSSFRGSQGEIYLAAERGLSPELSYHLLDVGFGDDRLIEGLLASGVSYDELLYYGILDISLGKNAHAGNAVKLLRRMSMSLDDLKRPGKDGKTLGLPYSILEGRVTYPLEIHKVINSIYGRSIDPNCPKPLRHRKTKSRHTGMKHGGLNLSMAVASEAPYIMVSEAVLNAATLLEMAKDIKAQTAIVGVNNLLLIELLAKSKKDIILAYDFDLPSWNEKKKEWGGETGQKNTILTRDRLVEYGFKGSVYDFTGGFVKAHPGIIYNDVNKYWTDYSGTRVNVLDYIQEIPQEYKNSMEP